MKRRDKSLAFGVEPSNRAFRLRLARYQGLIDAVRVFKAEAAISQGESKPLKLLDVGAGQGRTLKYLKAAGLDAGIDFVGVDNAPKRRDRLFEPDRWEYHLADAEAGLPFDDATFDIVVCEQVLEHLTDPDAVIHEIARVMKPGGMAVLGVPNFPPGMAFLRRHVVPQIDRVTGARRDHEQVFTKQQFLNLIERHGEFQVKRVQAFRCISGGLLGWLENYHWWYALNRKVATALSAFAIEIQVIAERTKVNSSGCRGATGDDVDGRSPPEAIRRLSK